MAPRWQEAAAHLKKSNGINHIGSDRGWKPADYIRCAGVFNGVRAKGVNPFDSPYADRSLGYQAPDIFRRRLRFQVSDTITGAPRPSPNASAALCSALAISSTPKELMRARNSPGRTSP